MPKGGRIPPAVSREREQRAWALVLDGVPQVEIAAQLEVTPQAISKLLQRVERRAVAEMDADVRRRKLRQHARLEHVYREAMTAWKRSQEPRRKSRRKSGGRRGEILTDEATTNAGAPGLLMAALDALQAQRKLWGLDAPRQLQVEAVPPRRPLEQLSDAQLAQRVEENLGLLLAEDASNAAETTTLAMVQESRRTELLILRERVKREG